MIALAACLQAVFLIHPWLLMSVCFEDWTHVPLIFSKHHIILIALTDRSLGLAF
jgi:hypothetical protein